MPEVFKWLSYLTFQKYSCELLIVTEFHGLEFSCSESTFAPKRPPTFQMQPILDAALLLNGVTPQFSLLLCVLVGADMSTPLPGACLITEGDQIIEQGYPGALSRYTQDFLLLYAFLPALLLLGIISYKIRDRLVLH